MNLSFFNKRKILITGHTGFKGSWLCKLLINAGADVTGYALKPETDYSLFDICRLQNQMNSIIGDVRDLEHMQKVFEETEPEIVIHMAAQPIVRDSYKNPVYTYDVNVMGTVHVLESLRKTDSVKSFLNITTDKVYRNKEWEWGYREDDELNGFDPYSNSKSCSELITSSYRKSFFMERGLAVSTARAGNVIGGGDFAKDRILPDCLRAASKGKEIIVRNPNSIRPYQHVLEPITAYLLIVQTQYEDGKLADCYNIGPSDQDCWTTGDLVTLFCNKWNDIIGNHVTWKNISDGGPHEANYLKLDCSKLKNTFGWKPRWNLETAVEKLVEWNKVFLIDGNVADCMDKQIEKFIEL